MTLLQALLLFGAAVLAGMLNGVAGGGSFIAFPMLIFTGMPPIAANATNNAALWVGSLASVGAGRSELVTRWRELMMLGGTSLIGGVLGSLALLHTPQTLFTKLLPYLLLLATLLFAFSDRLMPGLPAHHQQRSPSPLFQILVILFQLAIATYGGFFGGGVGILMLATLAMMGIGDIHTLNAFKNFLATCINGVAMIPFLLAGAIALPQATLMSLGALVGGYLSVYYTRQLKPILVRRFVVVVGFSMTLYFFLRS